MATFVMEVFLQRSAASNMLLAICLDGGRVITHAGSADSQRLRGGGPEALKGMTPEARYTEIVNAALSDGFVREGKFRVEDGVVDWSKNLTTTTASSVANASLLPTAYVEFANDQAWPATLASLFADTTYSLHLTGEQPVKGSLIIQNGETILVAPAHAAAQTVTVVASGSHGAFGILAVLAMARRFKVDCFNAEGAVLARRLEFEELRKLVKWEGDQKPLQEEAILLELLPRPLRIRPDARGNGLFA